MKMTNEQISVLLENNLTSLGIRIQNKRDVWWQKLLGKILFFVPGYLRNYSNSVGKDGIHLAETVESSPTRWKVIVHEVKHLIDTDKVGLALFSSSYLFPQILALLALLAPFTSYWMLLWLTCLLPYPAVFRCWLETRAYAFNLVIAQLLKKDVVQVREHIVKNLTGSSYYYAMPSRYIVNKMLDHYYKKYMKHVMFHIALNELEGFEQPFRIHYNLLKRDNDGLYRFIADSVLALGYR